MPAAVIGGAIAATGAVASSVISSKGASNAANASAAAADRSAQVQQDIYNQNSATLSPYVQAGLPATQQINALLGLGGGTPATPDRTVTIPGNPGTPDWMAYYNNNPDLVAAFNNPGGRDYQRGGTPEAFAQWHYNTYGAGEGRNLPLTGATDTTTQVIPGTPAVDASQQAAKAFDTFRNSTGYDFRVKQGMNALNSGYAGAGTIHSGAAMKAALDYGQGMASQEFGNYLNALGSQQDVGLRAASANAGVGQQAASNLGNIYMTNGANQAGAALTKASAIGSGVSSLANLGGSILANNTGGSGLNMNQMNAMIANNNSFLAGKYGA